MDIQKQEGQRLIFNLAIPTCIGIALFLLFGGAEIVNPFHLDWIFTEGGDATQHYVGWNFFRHSPLLQWPFGMNLAYGEALGSSIVFSDSIPLFAFFFKIWHALLPTDFQYFGLWLGLCFVLQANFAWLIIARYTHGTALRAMGCALLALAPTMLYRMGGHEALTGQWLLLAALYLYLREPRSQAGWLALVPLAALIHAYLFAMVSAIWTVGFYQHYWREQRSWRAGLPEAARMAALVVFVLWAAGYFVSGNISAGGYGFYRLNLLAFFSPSWPWSIFFEVPLRNGDGEGFGYPGAGIYLLALAAIVLVIARRHALPLAPQRVGPLVVLCVIFFLYALSNHVALGSHELFQFQPPRGIEKLCNAFRATGRFGWPPLYAFEILLFFCVIRLAPGRLAISIVGACLVLQVADLTKATTFYRERWSHQWQNPLVSKFWQQVPRQYKRVAFVLPLDGMEKYGAIAYMASKNGMTVNGGYLARVDGKQLDAVQQTLLNTVRSGDYRNDTLYIFFNDEYWNEARAHYRGDGAVGVVDTYRVIAPGWRGCRDDCVTPDKTTDLVFKDLPDNAPYLQGGWSGVEPDGRWTNGPNAKLTFLLPHSSSAAANVQASVDLAAYVNAQHPRQVVNVSANGHPVATWTFDNADRQVRVLDIPAADLTANPGTLTIELDLPDAISPKALGQSVDDRNLAVKVRTVQVKSN